MLSGGGCCPEQWLASDGCWPQYLCQSLQQSSHMGSVPDLVPELQGGSILSCSLSMAMVGHNPTTLLNTFSARQCDPAALSQQIPLKPGLGPILQQFT